MIALPEAPVFADEAPSRAAATTPSLFVEVPVEALPGLGAVQAPATQPGIDDIVAERDEDEAHWALTRDEDGGGGRARLTCATSTPRNTSRRTTRRRPMRWPSTPRISRCARIDRPPTISIASAAPSAKPPH